MRNETEPSYLDPSSPDYDHSAAMREYAGVCWCGDFSCEAGWNSDAQCVNRDF